MSIDESLIRTIEETGQYRVLRRFQPVDRYRDQAEGQIKRGLVVDTETTSLDTSSARIIEIGMVEFEYDQEDHILGVSDRFNAFEDPGMPIPPEITALTGITDEMVRGRRIDDQDIARRLARVSLVVCHNADYDRPILERRFPIFARRHFACSVADIEWPAYGIATAKLDYVAYRLGFFYDAHRASEDAEVTLHALTHEIGGGRTAFQTMIAAARQSRSRIWALNSPFETKAILSARGYRWCGGEMGRPKSWFRDVPAEETDSEIAWLRANVTRSNPSVLPLSALHRFSDRAWATGEPCRVQPAIRSATSGPVAMDNPAEAGTSRLAAFSR